MRFLVFIGVTKFSPPTKSTPLKVNQSLSNHLVWELLKWSLWCLATITTAVCPCLPKPVTYTMPKLWVCFKRTISLQPHAGFAFGQARDLLIRIATSVKRAARGTWTPNLVITNHLRYHCAMTAKRRSLYSGAHLSLLTNSYAVCFTSPERVSFTLVTPVREHYPQTLYAPLWHL